MQDASSFTQTREVLDRAWDGLMLEREGGTFRTVGQLMLAGIDMDEVTHLLDVAITTYLRHEGPAASAAEPSCW